MSWKLEDHEVVGHSQLSNVRRPLRRMTVEKDGGLWLFVNLAVVDKTPVGFAEEGE